MKIYFKHYCGAITQYDYLFFDCMAEVPLHEENEALNNGWLPDDYTIHKNNMGVTTKSHWYQARQTRINLANFNDSKTNKKERKKCKDIEVKYTPLQTANTSELKDIFDKYLTYRNFKKWSLEPLLLSERDRKFFLVYYLDGKPIAFTFMRDVGTNSVFSTQFAWDYENPKLYLGKYANLAEIDYCIANNKDYMYLGFGYEKSCIYKSKYAGFEFWNGELWSDDIDQFNFLCERDSSLKHLSELEQCKIDDDKNIFTK